jgi:catechol 2,3-dioxygenase-like lactoylglutathione lyase family enzyme
LEFGAAVGEQAIVALHASRSAAAREESEAGIPCAYREAHAESSVRDVDGAAPARDRPVVSALSVHHFAVVVRDLARAEAFYVGVLGLPVLTRWSDDAGAPRSIWVSLGSAFLAIERAAASEPRRADDAPGLHCMALAIKPEERAGFRNRLEAAGFPIEKESSFSIYFRDPDQNLVALSHYPDRVE